MTLLIDAGNSRVKAGWTSTGRAADGEVLTLAHAELDRLLPWLAARAPGQGRAVGVNVAGAGVGGRIAALLAQAGHAIEWILPAAQMLGLRNSYRDPAQLGADRWMGMLGVWSSVAAPRPPLLLATFGTATTLDTTGPDDVYAGGLILPGPALMRESLAVGTAQLPRAAGTVAAYPQDTHAAITTGVAAAQAGAVLRQCLQARSRYGTMPEVFVSGGGWPDVEAETRALLSAAAGTHGLPPPVPRFVPHPVLDGLARFAGAAPRP